MVALNSLVSDVVVKDSASATLDRVTAAMNKTADAEQRLQDGIAQTDVKVQGSTKSLETAARSFESLKRAADPAYDSMTRLADQQAKLQKAVALGVSTQEEANAVYAALSAKAAAAVNDVNGLTSAHGHLTGASTKVREALVLVHETLSGNFHRAMGSATIEAQAFAGGASNLVAILTNPFVLGTAAAAASLIAFAVASHQTSESLQAVNSALGLTGGAIGLSRGQLEGLAQTTSDSSDLSVKAIRALEAQYVATGKVSGGQLTDLISLTDRYSKATGQSAEEAAKELSKVVEDPQKGIADLDAKWNVLTVTQQTVIRQFLELGNTQGALSTFFNAFGQRIDAATPKLTSFGNLLHTVGKDFSNWWDSLGKIGTVDSAGQQLAAAQKQLDQVNKVGSFDQQGNDVTADARSNLEQQIALLQKKANLEADTAAAKGAQLQDQANGKTIEALNYSLQQEQDVMAASLPLRAQVKAQQEADNYIKQQGIKINQESADGQKQYADIVKNFTDKALLPATDAFRQQIAEAARATQGNLAVADAWKLGEGAADAMTAKVQAQEEAATKAGVSVAALTKSLLNQKAANDLVAGAKFNDDLQKQVDNQTAMNAAILKGSAAVADLTLKQQQLTDTQKLRADLSNATDPTIRASIQTEIDKTNDLAAAKQQAMETGVADALQFKQDYELRIAQMTLANSLVTDPKVKEANTLKIQNLQSELEIRRELGNLDPAEVKARVDEQNQINAINQSISDQAKISKRTANDMNRAFSDAARAVQSSFTDAFAAIFSGSANAGQQFANQLLSIMERLAAQIATLLIFHPEISLAQALSGAIGGTGAAGTTANDNGASSGGGLLSSLSNIGGLLNGQKSLFGPETRSSIDAWGYENLGTSPTYTVTNTTDDAGNPVFGQIQTTGDGLSDYVGTAGASIGAGAGGAAIGTLLAGALGEKSQGAGIGSAVGAAIGTAIFPVVGTFVGAILGSLIGGLFGPNAPAVAGQANVNIGSNGQLVAGNFAASSNVSSQDLQTLSQQTSQLVNGLNALFTQYGITASGTGSGGAAANGGGFISLGKDGTGPQTVQDFIKDILAGNTFQSGSAASTIKLDSSDPVIQTILKNTTAAQSGDANQLQTDLAFSTTYEQIIAIANATTTYGQAVDATQQSITTVIDNMADAKKQADDLGLDTSQFATTQQTELSTLGAGFIQSLKDGLNSALGMDFLTNLTTLATQAKTNFQSIDDLLKANAITSDQATGAQSTAMSLLDTQIQGILGGLTTGQLQDVVDQFAGSGDQFGQEIEKIAEAVLAATGTLGHAAPTFATAIQSVIDSLTKSIQDSISKWQSVGSSLTTYSQGLLTGSLSPLSPTQQLAQAQQQYSTDYAAAQGGDVNAASNFQQDADTLLKLAQTYYGSGSGYVAVFNQVQKGLADVAATATTQADYAQQQLDKLGIISDSTSATATNTLNLAGAIDALKNALAAQAVSQGPFAGTPAGGAQVLGNLANAYSDYIGSGGTAAGGEALLGSTRDAAFGAITDVGTLENFGKQYYTGNTTDPGAIALRARLAALGVSDPGFATGGGFTAAGSPGNDNLWYGMRLTQGERVSVTHQDPAQSNREVVSELRAMRADNQVLRLQVERLTEVTAQSGTSTVGAVRNGNVSLGNMSRAMQRQSGRPVAQRG